MGSGEGSERLMHWEGSGCTREMRWRNGDGFVYRQWKKCGRKCQNGKSLRVSARDSSAVSNGVVEFGAELTDIYYYSLSDFDFFFQFFSLTTMRMSPLDIR